jgi:hypothetical protein
VVSRRSQSDLLNHRSTPPSDLLNHRCTPPSDLLNHRSTPPSDLLNHRGRAKTLTNDRTIRADIGG